MATRNWSVIALLLGISGGWGCSAAPAWPTNPVVDFAQPGPIELETVVSARWAVPAAGMVNLHSPVAQAANINGGQLVPIQLLVHVIRHPQRGLFVVDTGVTRARARGEDDGVRGLATQALLASVEVVEPLADILARQPAPLAGVLFSHAHIDHVLGLREVPVGTPLYSGPNEMDIRQIEQALLGPTFDELFRPHGYPSEIDFNGAAPFGPVSAGVDFFGDGSMIVLSVPGHTKGSLAFYVRTTRGPVLLTGDVSHLLWGWDNGVEPGILSADLPENAASLLDLRELVRTVPGTRVVVGHETDGIGTGI